MDSKYFYSPDDDIAGLNPPPDIHELFAFYNRTFFDNILDSCKVKWSKKMTVCVGYCYPSSRNSCTITLSEPLLQFRSNNELKETLIHEMIHAYLFLTNPNASAHGAEFKYLMNFINEITYLNNSIYHSFFDEMEAMKKHVWKCTGKCVKEPPFFGIVKRAMNRAPGPAEPWWWGHLLDCGGVFLKISGPEKAREAIKADKKGKKEGNRRKGIENPVENLKKIAFFDEKCLKEETAKKIYLFSLVRMEVEEAIEILKVLISEKVKVKDLKKIICSIFNGILIEELEFLPHEYGRLDPESPLLEMIETQGILKVSMVYLDFVELALIFEFVYEISPSLNPAVKEASCFPKVFGLTHDNGSSDGSLSVLDKQKINEKLKLLFQEV